MVGSKRIILTCASTCLVFVAGVEMAQAGTALKINSATANVVQETLVIEGLNFPQDGSLEVWIGDSLLQGCSVQATSASCPITGTPALGGGTWTVRLTAGNSPNMNAAIDVFVLSGGTACSPGDWVNCYPGDRSEIGVGICAAGTRSCGSGGNFGVCEGMVTPQSEWGVNGELCGNQQDDDCDGVVDNGCDRLTENPSYFRAGATFSIPPGVTAIRIEAFGGGGAGGSATGPVDLPFDIIVESAGHPLSTITGVAGGGGGAGARAVIESYAVSEGERFTVHVGRGGDPTAFRYCQPVPYGCPGGDGGQTQVSKLDGNGGLETILVAAGGSIGRSPAGGLGGDESAQGGGEGGRCSASYSSVPGRTFAVASPGAGGDGWDGGFSGGMGYAGDGEGVYCEATCEIKMLFSQCLLTLQPRGLDFTTYGRNGGVIVSWQ